MGDTCCGCFRLKTGILMLTIIDLLALVSHIANCILIKRARDDTQKLGEKLFETAKELEVNIFDVDWKQVEDLIYVSLDLMTAIAALLVALVFFPRLIMYVAIRMKKTEYSRRSVAYKVRLVGTILHVLLCLACMIGLIVCMMKTSKLTSFIAIPGIIVYSLLLVWVLAFDIYYCCVYKRYFEKSKKKLAPEDKVQKYSTQGDQSIDHLYQQKGARNHTSKHSQQSNYTLENNIDNENYYQSQKSLKQKNRGGSKSGQQNTQRSSQAIGQDQHYQNRNGPYGDQWNMPQKQKMKQPDVYQQSPLKQQNQPSYFQQNEVNYENTKQGQGGSTSPAKGRRRRRKQ
eukprot:403334516